jgi:hypothetical protein
MPFITTRGERERGRGRERERERERERGKKLLASRMLQWEA